MEEKSTKRHLQGKPVKKETARTWTPVNSGRKQTQRTSRFKGQWISTGFILNSAQQNTSFRREGLLGGQGIPCYYRTHIIRYPVEISANNAHPKTHKSTAHPCNLSLQTPFKYRDSYILRSCKKHLIRNTSENFVCNSHLSVTVMTRLRVVRPRNRGSISSEGKKSVAMRQDWNKKSSSKR